MCQMYLHNSLAGSPVGQCGKGTDSAVLLLGGSVLVRCSGMDVGDQTDRD